MDQDDLVLAMSGIFLVMMQAYKMKKRPSKRRRIWCKQWLQRRNTTAGPGILKMINEEIRLEDPLYYKNFLRVTEQQFNYLLALVETSIGRQDTNMREAIPARHKLEITLRFLATGESYKSLMFSTRIHDSTICKFVPYVCKTIYLALREIYLKTPSTVGEWEEIAKEFEEKWQFPNCLGALDGRHITFRASIKDGSYYYNYKGTHSIVLLALVDAKYRFIYTNVGVNGRISDGGVLYQSGLARALQDNSLNFPPHRCLPGRKLKVPYVTIADDAFPLSTRLLKPYAKYLDHDRKIFNYRLSRASRMVESAFGIFANRFRILMNPINLAADKVETVTLACIALHNFLTDHKTKKLTVMEEENLPKLTKNLTKIIKIGTSRRPTTTLLKIRDEYKYFFLSTGMEDWQETALLNNNM